MTSSAQENQERLHIEDDMWVRSLNVVVLKYIRKIVETPPFKRGNLIPTPFSVRYT